METLSPVPNAPGALPVLGHALPLLRDPLAFLRSLPEHGDLVRVRIGPSSVTVVCDPELTRLVLRDDRTFDKGGALIDRAREVLGDGVSTCPHDRHRRQRRLVQPAFRTSRLPGYAQAMTAQAAGAADSWHEGQILDVLHEMRSISARTALATMFSDALPSSSLRVATEDVGTVVEGWYRRMFMPPLMDRVPTRGSRRYYQARARLRDTVGRVVRDRRADGTDHGDLLSVLAVTDSTDDGLSDAEIVNQLVTFFIGGTEAIASTLAWALYELDQHPDVRDRVHAEIDTVLAGGVPQDADIPRLDLTGRVITETLRLWSSPIVTRAVTVTTTLGGHRIEPGTIVAYSPYLVHHRADLYDDPCRFDPERWSPERAGARSRDAFIPFGGGARRCVGDQYAMVEAVLALATIVSRRRLESVPGQRVRPAVGTFIGPRGLRMRVTERVPSSRGASDDLSATARPARA